MTVSVPAVQNNHQLTTLLTKPQSATANAQSFGPRFEDVLAKELSSAKAADNVGTSQATAETFKKFEAFVLQTFIQEMMPENTESVFGKGFAGDVWKSMLAEKMAEVVAKHGGIGIADLLEQKAQSPIPSDRP